MASKRKKFSGIKFRKNGSDIQKRVPYTKLYLASIFINLIVIILTLLLNDRLPPEIPLYYGLPKGTGQIASVTRIYLPSLTALGFIIINTVIILLINSDFLKKSLVITGMVLSIFALTTTFKIMFLVGDF